MTFPLSADSEHDARERFMAKPDAPSAGRRSDVASTRAAAVPPESRSRSRTDASVTCPGCLPWIRETAGVSRPPSFAGFAGLLTSAAGPTHLGDEVEPVRPHLRAGLDGNANRAR